MRPATPSWPPTLSAGRHIEPDDDGNLGASTDDSDDAETWVLVCLAGYAAVAAACLSDPEDGCDDDFEKAGAAIGRWAMAPIADWKARAVEGQAPARERARRRSS
jgi:hypothetical protein